MEFGHQFTLRANRVPVDRLRHGGVERGRPAVPAVGIDGVRAVGEPQQRPEHVGPVDRCCRRAADVADPVDDDVAAGLDGDVEAGPGVEVAGVDRDARATLDVRLDGFVGQWRRDAVRRDRHGHRGARIEVGPDPQLLAGRGGYRGTVLGREHPAGPGFQHLPPPAEKDGEARARRDPPEVDRRPDVAVVVVRIGRSFEPLDGGGADDLQGHVRGGLVGVEEQLPSGAGQEADLAAAEVPVDRARREVVVELVEFVEERVLVLGEGGGDPIGDCGDAVDRHLAVERRDRLPERPDVLGDPGRVLGGVLREVQDLDAVLDEFAGGREPVLGDVRPVGEIPGGTLVPRVLDLPGVSEVPGVQRPSVRDELLELADGLQKRPDRYRVVRCPGPGFGEVQLHHRLVGDGRLGIRRVPQQPVVHSLFELGGAGLLVGLGEGDRIERRELQFVERHRVLGAVDDLVGFGGPGAVTQHLVAVDDRGHRQREAVRGTAPDAHPVVAAHRPVVGEIGNRDRVALARLAGPDDRRADAGCRRSGRVRGGELAPRPDRGSVGEAGRRDAPVAPGRPDVRGRHDLDGAGLEPGRDGDLLALAPGAIENADGGWLDALGRLHRQVDDRATRVARPAGVCGTVGEVDAPAEAVDGGRGRPGDRAAAREGQVQRLAGVDAADGVAARRIEAATQNVLVDPAGVGRDAVGEPDPVAGGALGPGPGRGGVAHEHGVVGVDLQVD